MEATRPTAASALSRASLWYSSGDVCAPGGQTVGGGTGLYLTPAPGVSKWRVSKRGTASPGGAWRWHGEVIAPKSPNKYALSPPAAFSAHHHPSTPDDLSSVSPSFPLSTLPSLFFLFPLSSLHPSPPRQCGDLSAKCCMYSPIPLSFCAPFFLHYPPSWPCHRLKPNLKDSPIPPIPFFFLSHLSLLPHPLFFLPLWLATAWLTQLSLLLPLPESVAQLRWLNMKYLLLLILAFYTVVWASLCKRKNSVTAYHHG